MAEIYIYSGPVRSGKTSKLDQWIKKQRSVDGVLAPVIENKRHLKFIAAGDKFLIETELDDESKVYRVGRYKFLKSVFRDAVEYLDKLRKNPSEWIVIDEIGWLELDGQGLEPAVSELLNELKYTDTYILLVVRDFLKGKIISHYKFEPEKINEFVPG
ncbi:MAG: nucleoside-triphosphatase [Calditrichaceae bacterium]|jgi:nucleoside-triphosphatase